MKPALSLVHAALVLGLLSTALAPQSATAQDPGSPTAATVEDARDAPRDDDGTESNAGPVCYRVMGVTFCY